jgi:4-diphosphocytidyl-2-C-methyl-D-erythritol kinase
VTGRPQQQEVVVRAPGKINLALTVGRRMPDGYHPLATVFQAVSLHEEVTVRPAEQTHVTVEGLHADRVPTDASNLALRAVRLMADHVGVDEPVHVHVRKGVPVAGGMAGGSADAAATLLALDQLWSAALAREELADLAALLGSDVPFCLLGGTAVGRGRGDLLTPALSRGEYHWALSLRDEGLSTPAVFQVFDEVLGGVEEVPEADRALLHALSSGDPAAVGAALANDLQDAALELAPDLVETLAIAEDAGALGVLVSGSGPTVAALGRTRQHATAIAAALMAAGVADDVMTATGPVPGARVVPADGAAGARDRG